MYREAEHKIYENWLKMYGSSWFQESTQEMIDLLGVLAKKASEAEKEKMEEQFIIAKEYELAFWEMSYTFETSISEKKRIGILCKLKNKGGDGMPSLILYLIKS